MIPIKTQEEIAIMTQAGRILAKIIRQIKAKVEPGLTTQELDKLAQELIFESGVKPAFKGYQGFPANLCTSINEQIVHGLPSQRKLNEGDILSLDLGIIYQGLCVDMAITLPIGAVSDEALELIRVTKKALRKAVARVKSGKTIGDISFAIQKHVQAEDLKVVRELCGHGIGRHLHEEPEVPNFGQQHKGPKLETGMVLALEPMIVLGQPKIKKSPDGFAYQTADNSLSAHFEHTVVVTENGPRILTE